MIPYSQMWSSINPPNCYGIQSGSIPDAVPHQTHTTMIQRQDVIRVAHDIKMQLTESEIDAVLNEYQNRDVDDEWHIVVEDIIYEIKTENQ